MPILLPHESTWCVSAVIHCQTGVAHALIYWWAGLPQLAGRMDHRFANVGYGVDIGFHKGVNKGGYKEVAAIYIYILYIYIYIIYIIYIYIYILYILYIYIYTWKNEIIGCCGILMDFGQQSHGVYGGWGKRYGLLSWKSIRWTDTCFQIMGFKVAYIIYIIYISLEFSKYDWLSLIDVEQDAVWACLQMGGNYL